MKKSLNNNICTFVFALLLQFFQLLAHQVSKQFLSLNLRHCQLIGVVSDEELFADKIRETNKSFSCPHWHLFTGFLFILSLDLINLCFDANKGRQKGWQSFWDEDTSKISFSLLSSNYNSDNIFNNIFKIPSAMTHFFTNDGIIRLGWKCALKCQMRRISAHEPDEVPILGVGRSINHQVTDQGRICMGGCGEPNRNL